MKKTLSLILVILILISTTTITVSADTSIIGQSAIMPINTENIYSEQYGNVFWEVDNNTHTVTIIGNGEVETTFDRDLYYEYLDENAYYDIIIEGNITSIGSCTFTGIKINTITIPSTVEKIEQGAFADTHINDITIPNTIRYVEEGAFKNSQIEEMTWQSNTEYYNVYEDDGESAFPDAKITELILDIDTNIEPIYDKFGEMVVLDRNIFKYVEIESLIVNSETIYVGAFEYTKIGKVTLTSNVKEIGGNAFAYTIFEDTN